MATFRQVSKPHGGFYFVLFFFFHRFCFFGSFVLLVVASFSVTLSLLRPIFIFGFWWLVFWSFKSSSLLFFIMSMDLLTYWTQYCLSSLRRGFKVSFVWILILFCIFPLCFFSFLLSGVLEYWNIFPFFFYSSVLFPMGHSLIFVRLYMVCAVVDN